MVMKGPVKVALRWCRGIAYFVLDFIFLIPFLLLALIARIVPRLIDVGLGPEPMINNIYFKKALLGQKFTAETFVNQVYYITDQFDLRGDVLFRGPLSLLRNYYLFLWSILRYRCLYISFNGGPLGFTSFLWKVEPFLYKIAGTKIVILPYGADVQEMTRSPNLLFKDAMRRDYPRHKFRRRGVASRIDLWTKMADHIIAGCEWVDYLYYWDTLMLGHFSIDTELWKPIEESAQKEESRSLKILHAPNHRNIKGTQYFSQAVQELRQEGLDIELVIVEKMPNERIREMIDASDIVADQLIVGWYAFYAIEAMAMGKPVLCFLRKDLEDLFINSGLISAGEIPIINCTPRTIKDTLRNLALKKGKILEIGKRSREYVVKHHSLEAVGKVFAEINRSLGIEGR